jgi:hypothetical protein
MHIREAEEERMMASSIVFALLGRWERRALLGLIFVVLGFGGITIMRGAYRSRRLPGLSATRLLGLAMYAGLALWAAGLWAFKRGSPPPVCTRRRLL